MTFNFFVLPFFFGLIYVIVSIIKRYMRSIQALQEEEKTLIRRGLRSRKLLLALKEVFFESLLHRKMFRKNFFLGYMHMSFAFGWLLLIVIGNMESRIYSGLWINPPYYPIFLKFFIHDKHVLPFEIFTVPGFFRFSMDLILFFILVGLSLAFIKRRRSKWFGMRKTTQHSLVDKVAMTTLWLIFPSRLLAESLTAGAYGYGGGFITQHLGNVLAFLWPLSDKFLAYGFWWIYSLALGIFFVTLPYTRYMHIPMEVLLIFFRNFGIGPRKEFSVFSEVEVLSCSRCGVCIDICQLNSAAQVNNIQSVYFVQSIRNQNVEEDILEKCLVCGRCENICPVGIRLDSLRITQRRNFTVNQRQNYQYLPPPRSKKNEVIYFAGCMSHLTPSITSAMTGIMKAAGVNFLFLDEERSICCGRPLTLAGKEDEAMQLMNANKALIQESGARVLVTSCPICLRVFKEKYQLDITILHHSQFLLDLIKKGKIPIQSYFKRVAYHDPCDLGRGLGILSEPRELIRKVSDPVILEHEKSDSLCCGGSLGLLNTSAFQRDQITKNTVGILVQDHPEILVTSCPLCKKTLAKFSHVRVADIAELVAEAIPGNPDLKRDASGKRISLPISV
jgi:Fe-S oxidoreductase